LQFGLTVLKIFHFEKTNLEEKGKTDTTQSSLSSPIPTLLPLATRGEQGDHFPGIFWHHSAPLVACGASCLPFAKVSLFLMISGEVSFVFP
jgi:hypothetical protein